MNFIRKIAEKKTDSFVKRQFTRYGKGAYENKAILQVTKGSAYSINTSFEFAGEFAYMLAETILGKTHVTGGIITTQKELDVDFELAGMKQFAGVRTFLIDTDMNKNQIQSLFDKFPSALILLSFSTDKGTLKTKVKNPKSAKPSNKDEEEEPKADFCSLKIKDESYVKDLLFDVNKDYKKVFIKHTFYIEDLEIPKEYMNDFAKARLFAIRKGKLIRQISIDGEQVKKEYKLEV
jgi:hypothetical protein